jgi:Fic family protein
MKTSLSPPQAPDVVARYGLAAFSVAGLPVASLIAPGGRYLHWDDLRHRPAPIGLTSEQWWMAVKLSRSLQFHHLPLLDKDGRHFRYAVYRGLMELLHSIDRDAMGTIHAPAQLTSTASRDRYLLSALAEEAITSSQLEGAATTSAVARDMLREQRAPSTHGERMIVNNYRAMEWMRTKSKEPLTPEMLLELHTILTHNTMEEADAVGRWRRDSDDIVVSDETGRLLHRPPPERELPDRIAALCRMANAHIPGDRSAHDRGHHANHAFLHPVLRAILLHFQLAYDHPFVDGNGRTARALFYLSMARQGYWLAEYISLSAVLKRARARYLRSFLFVETDDRDVTYFFVDQLRAIRAAIDSLYAYLDRKAKEIHDTDRALRRAWHTTLTLNERQLALLSRALRVPAATFTIESHRGSHGVSYQTARTDLLSLETDGLLERRKRGREFLFVASTKLAERVR